MTVTQEQLAKINQYGSADLPPLELTDVVAVSFIATNNLIGRNQGKWTVETLQQIADLLPGLSMTCDHDWNEVEDIQGVVFDARVVKSKTAPERLVQVGGNGDLNAQVISDEGYVTCVCDVAFYATSTILSMLRLGAVGKVSVGGFCGSEYICPLCACEFGDEGCNHYIPYDADDAKENPQYAPYFVRDGAMDMGEISLVLIPNIPGAGIITREFSTAD